MARTMTEEQKEAVRTRMKAYWAKKHKEQKKKVARRRKKAKAPTTPPPASVAAWASVRIIATHNEETIVVEHQIQSIGGLVDLLGEGCQGLSEVLIRIL